MNGKEMATNGHKEPLLSESSQGHKELRLQLIVQYG